VHALDPIALAFTLGLLALVPLLLVTMTSFLKFAVVLAIVRNALGVQQIPPNIALYGLALLLTVYVMAPVGRDMAEIMAGTPGATTDVRAFVAEIPKAAEPLRQFMVRNSKPEQREFFISTAQRLWPPKHSANVSESDFWIVTPAFLVSELTSGFEIGFLLYLPFIVIDLVISNILMAMGMMMVSPVTISLPLKLFLFVMVDGWSRLIHGMVQTFQ
jgi:type III secretion protein R